MRAAAGRSAGALLALAMLLAQGACGRAPAPDEVAERAPALDLVPASFHELQGWQYDHPGEALAAFRRSCVTLAGRSDDEPFGRHDAAGRVGDWRRVCAAAARLPERPGAAEARAFFETWFQPFLVRDGGEPVGLFTGYYEPLLRGARHPDARYRVPLHRPPQDLVRIDLGRFNPELAGYWIAGRIENGGFEPYHPRAAIEAGALAGQGLELLYVDDPIDKFFLQIQGSGQVQLEDGSRVRVGYAAQNGHPYRAIGRDLIEIGALVRDEVTMQSIRTWLEAHPQDAQMIMARNRSYVFFREQDRLGPDDGPLGAQSVPLTAGRSLAVDLRYLPLGAPVWLETTAPWPEGELPFQRLMIAQDTGGAIKGIVRGDIFFGAGPRAEAAAGRMKHPGRYALFLPRALTPLS